MSSDKRNPDYPPHQTWDQCKHEWEAIDSMFEGEVRCKRCLVPGDREKDGSVYWPAT